MSCTKQMGFFSVKKLIGCPIKRGASVRADIYIAKYNIIATHDEHVEALFSTSEGKSFSGIIVNLINLA